MTRGSLNGLRLSPNPQSIESLPPTTTTSCSCSVHYQRKLPWKDDGFLPKAYSHALCERSTFGEMPNSLEVSRPDIFGGHSSESDWKLSARASDTNFFFFSVKDKLFVLYGSVVMKSSSSLISSLVVSPTFWLCY